MPLFFLKLEVARWCDGFPRVVFLSFVNCKRAQTCPTLIGLLKARSIGEREDTGLGLLSWRVSVAVPYHEQESDWSPTESAPSDSEAAE